MNIKHYEPAGVFNALSQELDRWIDATSAQAATRAWSPAADVEETDAWVIRHTERLAGRRNADAIAMPAE